MMLLSSIAFSQVEELIPINIVYSNSDTVTTLAFKAGSDSTHWFCSFSDSVDMDLYYEYSNGKTWSTSAKLADIVFTAANDTAISVNIDEPHIYARFKYIFNSSGNDSDTSGYLRTWERVFK